MRDAMISVMASVAVMCGPVPAVAALAGPVAKPAAPVLWEGTVLSADGRPMPGVEVAATLSLPVSAFPAGVAGLGRQAAVPLAVTRSGADGRFALRAVEPAGLPAAFRESSWSQVVVSAAAPDGSWAFATDSVRYVRSGAFPSGGMWATTAAGADNAARLAAGDIAREATPSGLARSELAAPGQRPANLELQPPAPAPAGASVPVAGPGKPYVGCTRRYVEDRQKGFRTIGDIDVEAAWSYILNYQETRSTAWQVGYEQPSGGWAAAGTASFSQKSEKGFDTEFGPYPSRFRESYQVELIHAKTVWQCGSQTSPGPFYVRTVEPERWTGGTYNQGDPDIGCRAGMTTPVAGNTVGWRSVGRVSTYSATGSVFGFAGRATVEYSEQTRLGWKNHHGSPRHVCGESDDPFDGRTRVKALER